MIKWNLVLAVAVILLGLFAPQLSKLGLWKLPRDDIAAAPVRALIHS